MRLPFLRSKEDPATERARAAAAAVGGPPHDAAQARTRARQRLVGALVLLAVGVIGFPILFETQPRPLPVDTPIEIVRQDGSVSVATAPAAAGKVRPVTLPPPDAGIEAAPSSASAAAAAATQAPPSPTPPPSAATPVTSAVAPVVVPAKPPKEEKPRERPASAPAAAAVAAPVAPPAASAAQAGRFVVQAGAYLDANSLRDARQKVEKLGLKTYTQVVETPTGKRTRVRVGPFESRTEADGVAARIKAAGLSVVVLTL